MGGVLGVFLWENKVTRYKKYLQGERSKRRSPKSGGGEGDPLLPKEEISSAHNKTRGRAVHERSCRG